ncbi:MAG: transposase [Gammaproteobacteria bacterium]|nr:transposase [Gammaproteobacteria bacterium]
MPRRARILLPNTPHHIVQRGHNRASVFARADDYRYYLATLIEWKQPLGLKLYAYCLMTNHVHLIVEPGEAVSAVGQLMRRLAGRQTRFVNALEGRTGSLWEGRYKASAIQSERYLLACSRYVELNPVRAGMVASAADYAWSSYHAKVDGCWPSWLDEDECYRSLGANARERSRTYREYVEGDVNEEEQALIRTASKRNQLTGDKWFVEEVARRVGRRIEFRGRGRPRQPQK